MNLIQSLPAVDDKMRPLMKSYINAVLKMQELGITLPAQADKRTNPYSGMSHELTPIQLAIFDFIIEVARHYEKTFVLQYRGKKVTQSTFDNARYLFMTLWPNKYYDLLD